MRVAFTLPQNSPNVQLISIPNTVVVSVVSAKQVASKKQFGEMAEWLKAHAWKVCIRL